MYDLRHYVGCPEILFNSLVDPSMSMSCIWAVGLLHDLAVGPNALLERPSQRAAAEVSAAAPALIYGNGAMPVTCG
jgi:hypothetical protein